MDQLYKYFRDLSEGKLDITKTVEYQFIKAMQSMETPIKLENFAAQVNLTSIILKFLSLTTNAGIFTQSQFGLDTNIKGSLDVTTQSPPPTENINADTQPPPPKVSIESTTQSLQPPENIDADTQPPPPKVSIESKTQSLQPPESIDTDNQPPPPKVSIESTTQSSQPSENKTPVFVPSRTPGDSMPPTSPSSSTPRAVELKPVPSRDEKLDDAFEIDLPGHIKDRLKFERAKTGSKKSLDGSDGLNDLFDELGSLADALDDETS